MAKWVEKFYCCLAMDHFDDRTIVIVLAHLSELMAWQAARLEAVTSNKADIAAEVRLLNEGADLRAPHDVDLRLIAVNDVFCELISLAKPSSQGTDKLVLARLFQNEETGA